MADVFPPEASPARRRSSPLFWVLAGCATLTFGAILGVAGYRAFAGEGSSAPRRFAARSNTAEATSPSAKAKTAVEGGQIPLTDGSAATPSSSEEVAGGSERKPTQPSPIPGDMSAGAPGSASNLPLTPIVVESGPSELEKEARKPTRYVEVSLRVPQTEIETTESSLASLAVSLGGFSHAVHEARTPNTPERRGILIIVPEAKADEVLKEVLSIEVASIRDEWNGPFAERQLRVERPVRDVLHALDREERNAVERYLDDAPAVVDVRERIEDMKRQLSALPKARSDQAVLRVYIGHRL